MRSCGILEFSPYRFWTNEGKALIGYVCQKWQSMQVKLLGAHGEGQLSWYPTVQVVDRRSLDRLVVGIDQLGRPYCCPHRPVPILQIELVSLSGWEDSTHACRDKPNTESALWIQLGYKYSSAWASITLRVQVSLHDTLTQNLHVL